jgi:SAM-dependent methyltransferase
LSEIVAAYDREAETLATRYANVKEALGEPWWSHKLPAAPARVLDVGAGTGLDAAWLARRGYDVVAAEPSREMARIGRALTNGASVTWIEDALPDLSVLRTSGAPFDFLLCSAVLQHIPVDLRARAFQSLAAVAKESATAAVLVRRGPSPAGRTMFPVDIDETCDMATQAGFIIEEKSTVRDPENRPRVAWLRLFLRRQSNRPSATPRQ